MRFRTIFALLVLAAMVYFIGFPQTPEWTGKVVQEVKEKTKDVNISNLDQLLPRGNENTSVLSTGDLAAYFCAVEDCAATLLALLNASDYADCALYDVTIPDIVEELRRKAAEGKARLVVDDEATEKDRALDFAKRDGKQGLMHDKFCIFDSQIVWMGSFNPTSSGAKKNDNNVVVIRSKELAENYAVEFEELWNGKFGKGDPTPNQKIQLGSIVLENAFCPEDWCANDILRALHQAEHSVDFLTYSFTHDGIGDKLVEKHGQGIAVRGVAEKSQKNAFHEYDKLRQAGIDVRWDANPMLMHHKIFIIDGHTVITGSFNPTQNADTRNDENVLIIHDAAIASRFEEEFERILAISTE